MPSINFVMNSLSKLQDARLSVDVQVHVVALEAVEDHAELTGHEDLHELLFLVMLFHVTCLFIVSPFRLSTLK